MIIGLMIQLILAFFATLGFAIMFNVPKSELILAGLVGSFGWLFYQLALQLSLSITICTFVAALAVTIFSRILATNRKMPITLFLISGIIPLVPGKGIYDTMFFTINNDTLLAAAKGIETFKVAGVISIGIIIILSLPVSIFNYKTAK